MRVVYSWFSVQLSLHHFIIAIPVNICLIGEPQRNALPKTTVEGDLEATIILQSIVNVCLVAEGCTITWLHAQYFWPPLKRLLLAAVLAPRILTRLVDFFF